MPGRNPAAARRDFLGPLQRGLACVTYAQWLTSGPWKQPGDEEALTTSQRPLRFASALFRDGLLLDLRQRYHYERDAGGWHVSTLAYNYELDDGDGRELISWHWHPGQPSGNPYMHLHVAGATLGPRVHVPTGRVSIESIIRMLITDLGVPPAGGRDRDTCLRVLDQAERDFIEHRRRHG